MIEWKSIRRLLAPAALMLALPGTALAADCAEFEGIEHCAIGKASLSTTSSGLEVTGFGGSGSDGVDIRLDGATSWEIGTDILSEDASTSTLVVTALASGSPNSQMRVVDSGSQMEISTRFTGGGPDATYSAHVYQDGVYQGGLGGISFASSIRVTLPPLYPPPVRPRRPPIRGTGFGIVAQTGGCFHTADFSTSLVQLPDGQRIQGDRLELVEEVTRAGSYPYLSFDAIRVTGTVESLTITSETVKR